MKSPGDKASSIAVSMSSFCFLAMGPPRGIRIIKHIRSEPRATVSGSGENLNQGDTPILGYGGTSERRTFNGQMCHTSAPIHGLGMKYDSLEADRKSGTRYRKAMLVTVLNAQEA